MGIDTDELPNPKDVRVDNTGLLILEVLREVVVVVVPMGASLAAMLLLGMVAFSRWSAVVMAKNRCRNGTSVSGILL